MAKFKMCKMKFFLLILFIIPHQAKTTVVSPVSKEEYEAMFEEWTTKIMKKVNEEIMKKVNEEIEPMKTKFELCTSNNVEMISAIQGHETKINNIVLEIDQAKELIEEKSIENRQEEQNTDTEINNLDKEFKHLEFISKLIKVDSCTDLASNGIQKSGFYELDLGEPRNPTTTWCTLPDGETKLGEEITITADHCSANKCFSQALDYGASREQLEYLIDSSTSCYQNVSFYCISSPLQVS